MVFNFARYITLAILIVIWYSTARKEKLTSGLLTIFVSFFAFTHAFAIQYLMWLIPLAVLNQEYEWLKLYTMASFSYMFLTYNTVILNWSITNLLPYSTADLALIIPTTLPIWFICVSWTIQRIRSVHRFPRVQEELIASTI
jgi:hypothetical protein